MRLDLRDWLSCVKETGELVELEGVHWDVEMGALTQILHEQLGSSSAPALLFSKIPGYPPGYRTLYGTLSSMRRLALTLGLPAENLPKIEFLRRYRTKLSSLRPISPKVVKNGPILENVIESKNVNVLMFPSPKHHELDPARFIGTGTAVILRHPDEDWVNIGTYRSMVYDENTVGLEMSPTSDGGRIQKLYMERRQPMPVALCVGQHPLLYLVGSTSHKISEYDVAGGILDSPVEVVEGPTTGLPIPSSAEIVLEGYMLPGKTRPEGPFGEWMGYYASEVVERPFVEVKRILHRNDPILTCAPQHKPPDETFLLRSVSNAAKTWTALDSLGVQGVKGVWQHEGGAAKKFLVVSIEQAYPGHSRHTLHAAASSAGSMFGGSWVVVVDDDIDPGNITEVIWAMATRVNGSKDLEFIEKAPSGGLIDPLTGEYWSPRILVDACIPYDQKSSGRFPKSVTVSHKLRNVLVERFGKLFNLPPVVGQQ